VRYFHGCYSLGDDQLWGVNRERKSGANSLSALKSIRAARPDGAPIYVILDNLSANKTPAIRAWATANKVELCLTPTSASWANPIEAQFGPLRTSCRGVRRDVVLGSHVTGAGGAPGCLRRGCGVPFRARPTGGRPAARSWRPGWRRVRRR
jgi:hypothetical protein